MSILRESARGQACLVRVPGVCSFEPTETVLAHFRLVGVSGMGLKSPDLLGAFACAKCHDLIDGRTRSANWTREDVQRMHLDGVLRTLAFWDRSGFIKVARPK